MDVSDVARVLNRLPEVVWDRCTSSPVDLVVYGWIARDDGRSDFAIVTFDNEGLLRFSTSSARYSAVFMERLLGTSEGHEDCERVEDVFGDLVERKVVLDR